MNRLCQYAWMIGLLGLMMPGNAQAEEAVIYSYTKTAQQPADWTLLPVIADVPDTKPGTLFEAIKRKKLPTYGATRYDASANTVYIDDTKCAYGSIISAEIELSFAAHGHRMPSFLCHQAKQPASGQQLMRYVAVVPFWQALSANSLDKNMLVQLGDEYVSPSIFESRVSKSDKTVTQAIEIGLNDPNGFVRSGVMKGMLARRMPNAEKRISKELSSRDDISVNAAVEALAGTRDPAVIKQLSALLGKESQQRENRAKYLVQSSDKKLREEAMVILLQSSDDAAFNQAHEILVSQRRYDELTAHYQEILDHSVPSHAVIIVEDLLQQKHESDIKQWLDESDGGHAAQAAASTVIAKSAGDCYISALSMQLLHNDSTVSFDALDRLNILHKKSALPISVWMRGLLSPHLGVQMASAHALEQIKPAVSCRKAIDRFWPKSKFLSPYNALISGVLGAACSDIDAKASDWEKRGLTAASDKISNMSKPDNGYLLQQARLKAPQAVQTLTQYAFDSNVNVRCDVAYSTRWLDNDGDTLRTTMLKDNDESVVINLLISLTHLSGEQAVLPLVKEIINRSERSLKLKIASLFALPFVINEKNVQTITTFAGNEMFDNDESIKIAAIRSLSEIAQNSADPVIVDNAVTSLALTAQDKSSVIVHHTLMGLARTQTKAAKEIIERAKTANPDIYNKVKAIYP